MEGGGLSEWGEEQVKNGQIHKGWEGLCGGGQSMNPLSGPVAAA